MQTDDDLFDAYWHLAQAAPFGDVAWARNVLEIVPDQGWLMNVAGVMTEHGYRAQLRDLDTEAPRLSLDKLIDVLGPVLHGAHA
ncbi:hypothetical protein [Conexibacter sp. SYSU D00693]|uniref:hypothetical protein n=1 Tax=Conexibacter sp. SYSU D00693 TaxID=2812560 RepID=UPI00196AEC1A|nr:hypothetical protein [Conexibacter sp. SYSU D00693]